jgi:hypothetical protein
MRRYLVQWIVVYISEERIHKTAGRHIPESGSHNIHYLDKLKFLMELKNTHGSCHSYL